MDPTPRKGVIPARTVRRLDQAVVVDSGARDSGASEKDAGHRSLTIIPLVDGDLIAGLDIRCACGASAVVECVYDVERPS